MDNLYKLTVISGKGGTGKTTFSAQLSYIISKNGIVVADCDVDAPNLHLLLKPETTEEKPFMGNKKAHINQEKCTQCGLCYELCRFDAIVECDSDKYCVDDTRCEGCALCYNACPEKAVEMVEKQCGNIYISQTSVGKMVHASLFPGEENSGKLVMEVKELAKKIAEEEKANFIVVDGAPGIGCPVIASLSNTDLALVIAEPTLSGVSDMLRILELTMHFRIKSSVVINKYDVNLEVAEKIERVCEEKGIEVVGKIPYDSSIPEQVSMLSFPLKGEAADSIEEIVEKLGIT